MFQPVEYSITGVIVMNTRKETLMTHRLRKFLYSSLTVSLCVLLLHAVLGTLDTPRENLFCVISFVWLIITGLQVPQTVSAFEDKLLRRLVYIPTILGGGAAVVALVLAGLNGNVLLALSATAMIGAWAVICRGYLETAENYDTVGSGYLRKGVWLNPPLEVIPPGSLILTDGRMARRARNSVGHSELVVKDGKGKLHVASSYIETGVVVHTLRAFIAVERRNQENFIVLVPREPLTDEESARLFSVSESVLTANKQWRDRENERRKRLFNGLPLPAKWRAWLLKHALSTGYDPLGKYWGGTRKDRFTCMAHNLHLLRETGIDVREYGTGAFGLIGEFNPLVPIRLLQEPSYRVLTTADEAVFEESLSSVGCCTV